MTLDASKLVDQIVARGGSPMEIETLPAQTDDAKVKWAWELLRSGRAGVMSGGSTPQPVMSAHRTHMNSCLTPTIAFLQTDFETTGLNEVGGEIIQVGIIGTDIDYRPLFEVDVVVQPTRRTFELIEAEPFVKNMMTVNGLLDDINLGASTGLFPTLSSVERDVVALIERFSPTPAHKITLSGSGVGTFDFRWIRQHMPALAQKLNYWPDDVGILRRKWRDATGEDLVEVDKDKTHRAFDDVNCHIEESRVYRELFTRLGRLAGGGDLASVNALLDGLEARGPALV